MQKPQPANGEDSIAVDYSAKRSGVIMRSLNAAFK